MPRVKRRVTAWARHKKVISAAKGFHSRRNNVYHIAKQAVMRVDQYTYRDRRSKKRVLYVLRIACINAGAREHGLTYSEFMNSLKKASIGLGHRVLLDMVIRGKVTFVVIVNQVKASVA